jgi:hypothetical protein
VLIPILYLKGISTGDFEAALIALLGKDAGGLLPQPSGGSRRPGRTSIRVEASAISRPNATFTSGSTASMYKPGSRRPRSACW